MKKLLLAMTVLVALTSCEKDPETSSDTDHIVHSKVDGLSLLLENTTSQSTASQNLNAGQTAKYSRSLFNRITIKCPNGPGCEYIYNGNRYYITMRF